MSEEVKPVTAAEAWEHVKFVYGFNAEFIRKRGENGASLMLRDGSAVGYKSVRTELPLYQKIEWTDGAEEWPDRRWRTPTNEDAGQPIQYRSDGESEYDRKWKDGVFIYDCGETKIERRYVVTQDGHPSEPLRVQYVRIRIDLPRNAGLVKVQRDGKEYWMSREIIEDTQLFDDLLRSAIDQIGKKELGPSYGFHCSKTDGEGAFAAKQNDERLQADVKPEEPAKPAWEPKPGDWVKLTKPASGMFWNRQMDHLDGKVVMLHSPKEGREAKSGVVVIDPNIGSNMKMQWTIFPAWCSPAEPTQSDRDATLWRHVGKVWRLATDADKGREAVFADKFTGPVGAIVKRRLRGVGGVDGSFPFVTESMTHYKYAWVPIEPEPVQESKPVAKQYREPTAKDVARFKVLVVEVRDVDSEEWKNGHRLRAVLPDGEGFEYRFLTTHVNDNGKPPQLKPWKQARIAVDGV
jgi:hypothetical protein